ncbi:NTE family protein [Propionicimonas paludicola]|uniref:NTE family protein n=1 Tax=Propionicimonas paludicola TaxID=185243 RepID=A0A2A9CXR8_9ACTN|nr:patatin-like phospholipase family protein [Propionicimonas paludicola]PFG15504.1 NTE family protein [Propionicimonas paludicola]PFG18462.1 NTE family protein [Propionicimonas paludicola]
MTTPGLGLALGGGAVLGAAHLGVLQALNARGLYPEVVAGTSAGALVGAAYASGTPLDEIEELMLSSSWAAVGRLTLTPRLGILDSQALSETLSRLETVQRIEELPIRFGAVATDVRSGKTVVITSGSLADALRASVAIPGLFPPVIRDNEVLYDGGLRANLPIEAARQLGARWTIAVRLSPEWVAAPPGTAEAIAKLEREASTLTIRPDLRGLSKWSPADVPQLIEAGRAAAEDVLRNFHSFDTIGDHLVAGRLADRSAA